MSVASNIEISPRAANRVQQLIEDDEKPDMKLRVYIEGGGCSGFQYRFQLDQETMEDDLVIEESGISMIIDPISQQYLQGAQVDFLDDLMGSRFVVNNPNATTTCGCGSSFSI